MPFKISENISKTLVNAYNLSSQQKAIKDNSSVIYLLRDWSLFVTCGEKGVLEDLGRVTTIFTQPPIRFYEIPMTPPSLADS